MAPGRFIVLEGIDGSGTTSQSRRLREVLESRGHAVVATHQPSDGSIGRLLRTHLSADRTPLDPHAMALLFAADRLDHVARVVTPALARGAWVLCDRYVMSSWAYQSLRCEEAWVQEINARAPWPDLTLWLDVPVDVAQARIQARAKTEGTATEIYDRAETQRRVAAYYEAQRDRGHAGLHRVDGTAPVEAVTQALLTLIDGHGETPAPPGPPPDADAG